LVRLFVQRVEIRADPVRTRCRERTVETGETARRVLALRTKLQLPQLIEGVEANAAAKAEAACIRPSLAGRALSFETRMDFTHAMMGEVTIVTPFQHTLRVAARVRPNRPIQPQTEHAVVRARQWQRLLDQGQVANRLALAKRVGITSGAVTRITRLVELMPEIQDFLVGIKTREAVRHFTIKGVGQLATLPAEQQRAAFAKMKQKFSMRV
jgi:hypothetical protein